MDTQSLKVEKREITGRKVKGLRSDGILPANVYGKGIKSKSIQVNQSDFEKVYEKAGETGLVELSLGKTSKPVLVNNIQRDPVNDQILHVDFLQVDLKQKVKATVPIEVIGESPVEKQGLGTAVQQLDEVEVEALPTDLPEKFVVDISGLEEVDSSIYVKDLKVDAKKVKIEGDMDEIIVKVEPLRKEEEPEPVAKEEEVEGEGVEEGVADKEETIEGETKEEGEIKEAKSVDKPKEEKAKE